MPMPASASLSHCFFASAKAMSGDLRTKLRGLAPTRGSEVIFVRGDKGVDYGTVMDLLGKVGEAGFAKISLIAEHPPAP